VPLQRSRTRIREQRACRRQASLDYMRRTAPTYMFTQHPQHTYIHRHTHAHTHTQATCEIHAHVYTANVYHDLLQLTSSMHKAKDKGHRAHGQKEIMHTYGPKSTPIAQGLVEDINAMHVYGRSSAPIAQELVYDINAPHALELRESKPKAMHAYGRSSAPIVQGLVYDINAPHAFGLREPKPKAMHAYGRNSAPIAQGLVYDITPLCRHATIDKERHCVTQTTHHTIQEDTVEGGAAAMDSLRFVEEAGAVQDMAERNLAAEWTVLTTGSAMDNKRVPGFVPPPLPPTPSRRLKSVLPPWRPKCHTTVVTPTTMECSAMIIVDKGPNKG